MTFDVFDLKGRKVSALQVMYRHRGFYGKANHKDFSFAIEQSGNLVVISGLSPIRMTCSLIAFQHLYKVVIRA